MAKLKLVIPSLSGFKGAAPQIPAGAKLVDAETGEEVPGVANITLQIPQGGTLRCTAEINLSAIEVTEPIVAGKSFVDVHVNQQAEPGNGEDAPK
jgi:hypothetical protein